MKRSLVLFLMLLSPIFLSAHGSHGNGFMAGLTHPILGIDHLIAILGLSILATLKLENKWYILSLAFILPMAIGGVMGIGSEATLWIEKMIALSVGIIGLLMVVKRNIAVGILIILVVIFGAFHGFAHGAEMPESTTAVKYVSGFVVGATLISLLGWFIGLSIKKENYFLIIAGAMMGSCLILLFG